MNPFKFFGWLSKAMKRTPQQPQMEEREFIQWRESAFARSLQPLLRFLEQEHMDVYVRNLSKTTWPKLEGTFREYHQELRTLFNHLRQVENLARGSTTLTPTEINLAKATLKRVEILNKHHEIIIKTLREYRDTYFSPLSGLLVEAGEALKQETTQFPSLQGVDLKELEQVTKLRKDMSDSLKDLKVLIDGLQSVSILYYNLSKDTNDSVVAMGHNMRKASSVQIYRNAEREINKLSDLILVKGKNLCSRWMRERNVLMELKRLQQSKQIPAAAQRRAAA